MDIINLTIEAVFVALLSGFALGCAFVAHLMKKGDKHG